MCNSKQYARQIVTFRTRAVTQYDKYPNLSVATRNQVICLYKNFRKCMDGAWWKTCDAHLHFIGVMLSKFHLDDWKTEEGV